MKLPFRFTRILISGLVILSIGVIFTSESNAQTKKKSGKTAKPPEAAKPEPEKAPEPSKPQPPKAEPAPTPVDTTPKDPRPRIAVAPMGLGDRVLETSLTDTLVNYSRFQVVVARNQLNKILGEQKLNNSDLVNPATAQKVGKLVGANYIVVGRFMGTDVKTGFFSADKLEIRAQVQLIEVETGAIKFADNFSTVVKGNFTVSDGKGNQVLREDLALRAYRQYAPEIARKFIDRINSLNPLKGYVVDVAGAYAYINLGEKDGARIGQEYMIFADGNVIKDPVTGEALSSEKKPIARIVIASTLERVSFGLIFATNSAQANVPVEGALFDSRPVFSVVQPSMSLVEVERKGLTLLEDIEKNAKKAGKK